VKRTKKPSVSHDFLDAFADVIADRVATKLARAGSPEPRNLWVPKWLPGPEKPRSRRERGPREGKGDVQGLAQRLIREAGFLTFGDPGHDEVLRKYMEQERKHDVEREREAQMRRAVDLFDKILTLAAK
jgi:hypothetical protein